MKDLTIVSQCLLKLGAELQTLSTKEANTRLVNLVNDCIPEDSFVNIENLIQSLQEIKSGQELHVKDIIECHGRYTVKLNNGLSLIYNDEITHY